MIPIHWDTIICSDFIESNITSINGLLLTQYYSSMMYRYLADCLRGSMKICFESIEEICMEARMKW